VTMNPREAWSAAAAVFSATPQGFLSGGRKNRNKHVPDAKATADGTSKGQAERSASGKTNGQLAEIHQPKSNGSHAPRMK